MACGLPVIASNVDGNVDAVLDGETGFLIDPKDEEGLTSRLKELLDSSELREKLGQAGRSRVQKEFNYSRYEEQMIEVIGEVLA